jgi:hypothetical protein
MQTAPTQEQRRISNVSLVVMSGTGALILITVAVEFTGAWTVWLSWVMFAAAIIMLVASIFVLRASLAARRRAGSDPSA